MIRIWDVGTGTETLQLVGHTSRVWSAWWSPDSRRLATGSDDGTARVWDVATGRETLKLAGHTAGVLPVAWSPDGRQLVTGGDDGTARIWDLATGEQLRVIDGFPSVVGYAAWSPDGRQLVTLSGPGTAQVWLVDHDLIVADITRRVCALFSDAQIRAEIPAWHGCDTELAAVADDLRIYDQLQDDT
jgi:WD40 repeat protein